MLNHNESSSGYDFNFVKSRQQVINNLKSMPETDLNAILKQKQTGKNIILYETTTIRHPLTSITLSTTLSRMKKQAGSLRSSRWA